MKQNKITRREMAAARSDHDRLGKRVCGHVCERTRTRTRLRQLRGPLGAGSSCTTSGSQETRSEATHRDIEAHGRFIEICGLFPQKKTAPRAGRGPLSRVGAG